MPAEMRSITEESARVVAAHDLAGSGLGQVGDNHDLPRLGERADLGRHVLAQRLDRLGDARV